MMEVLQQTRCPAATRSLHLSASPPSSHTLTKPGGGVGGGGAGGRIERKAAQQRALTPTYLRRQGCTVADGMELLFIINLFIFFLACIFEKPPSAKVWHGVSGGLIRAVSVTTVEKKEMRPHYYFPPLPRSV